MFCSKDPMMVHARLNLNSTLDVLGSMRDTAATEKHPSAHDLSIAITHVEDALFRINRAAHTP